VTLELDRRQRAMLAEMGVRVWSPEPAAPAAPTPARSAQPDNPEFIANKHHSTLGNGQNDAQNALKTPPPRPVSAPARPQPVPPAATAGEAPARGPRPDGVDTMDWPALEAAVAGCAACGLCERRRHTVFGVGARQADWMVVGEAPGEQEDLRGEPFVGPAGQLLDAMLRAVGLSRQVDAGAGGVYIANVLKCRPPGNRNPQPDEIAQCEPYLRRQVALVRPKIILAMGRFAVQSLLQTSEPIGRLRGRVHQYEGVPVIVTYHPAYLLRALPEKAKAWDDLCLALEAASR
jgi:DNA polymerase